MKTIQISSTIHAPIQQVWEYWTEAQHIIHWNFASEDWHCPEANNILEIGGEFHYLMAAKDASFSFDFWGTYTQIDPCKTLEITLGDGRKWQVEFIQKNDSVKVIETFEPETENSKELQKTGWQMILENFKKYVESSK